MSEAERMELEALRRWKAGKVGIEEHLALMESHRQQAAKIRKLEREVRHGRNHRD